MNTLNTLIGDYDVVLNSSVFNENEPDLLTINFDRSATTAKPDPNQTYKLVNYGQRLEAGPDNFQCDTDSSSNENMFVLIFDESQSKFELRHVSHNINVGKAIPQEGVPNGNADGNGGDNSTFSAAATNAIDNSDDDDDDEELLGELANELEGSLDSDSDSDSSVNGGGMIQIVESSKPSNSSIRDNLNGDNGISNGNGGNRAQGGPISLRGFLSGQQRRENEEDLSSSEEE